MIVTINGVPSFEMVPLDENDDLIGQLLENHPGFRDMLKGRLGEKSISAKEALKRL